MSKLEELYKERKEQYDKYKQELIAYETRMDEYLTRINKSEDLLRDKIKNLPENIKAIVIETIPNLEELCTKENANTRLVAWRALYTRLEQLGLSMLEE